jgi:hypothetical protein
MAKKSDNSTAALAGDMVRGNNRWRESYNPLRGLIISKVVSLLEAVERGELADIQWLYRLVERRYPVLRALVQRRRAALVKLNWEIKKTEGLEEEEDAAAEAQVEFLRQRYEAIGNLKEAIKFLGLAEFRGYSILNKHRDADGIVRELHWLPQWNFARDGYLGDFYWNPEALQVSSHALPEANRIDPKDFIIREADMPINEIGVIAFLRTNLSAKDWDAFVEMFGIPGCLVILPPTVPPGKEEEYRSAAASVAEAASGALPNGSDAKFPTSAIRGESPFKEHAEWQEKDVVLAGTGGKLSMLTGPTGLGGGQAEVHEAVFDEIATAEAAEISEIFQRQFDLPELTASGLVKEGERPLAYFALVPEDKTAGERIAFLRELVKGWAGNPAVGPIVANQADIKELMCSTGVPLNEDYEEPEIKVTAEAGNEAGNEAETKSETDEQKEGEGADQEVEGAAGGGDATAGGLEKVSPGGEGAAGGAGDGEAEEPEGEEPETEKPVTNRVPADQGDLEAAGTAAIAKALASDLAPVRERLSRILEIEDPEILKARLAAFQAEVDALKADLLADPAMAGEIEKLLAAGMANGFEQ